MQPPETRTPPPERQSAYGRASWLILIITLLIWLATSTIFEAALVGVSPRVERWIGMVTLILPALLGTALGAIGFVRSRQHRIWAILGCVLNALVAVFFMLVLSFAG